MCERDSQTRREYEIGLKCGLCDVMCVWVGAVTLAQARFDDPMWHDFYQLADRVHEIFQTLINLRPSLETQQASVTQLRNVVTGLFITMVVLCNVFYYPIIIKSLNRSIKSNRALLLIFPEEVIRGVKELREAMLSMSKRLLLA